MKLSLVLLSCCYLIVASTAPPAQPVKDALDKEWNKLKALMPVDPLKLNINQTWCTCGVFLNGQFKRGQQPTGNAALLHEQDSMYPCTPLGQKQCTNKCLETVEFIENLVLLILLN